MDSINVLEETNLSLHPVSCLKILVPCVIFQFLFFGVGSLICKAAEILKRCTWLECWTWTY